MRERWARTLALLTGLLVLAMSALFAGILNPPDRPAAALAPAAPMTRTNIETGHAVFAAQGCARCHSIAGQGSPRSPLDGVGGRRDRQQLRQWLLADDAITAQLPARAVAAKRAYAALPEAELAALLDYLASLQ